MFRSRIVLTVILALVIVGLLASGAYALHRLGWMQGYAAGQLTFQSNPEAPRPEEYPGVVPGFGYERFRYGLGFPFFPPFFGFFCWAGGFLLLFLLLGPIFRFRHWGYYGAHHHHHHEDDPWHHGERTQPGGEPGAPGPETRDQA
ncbi:MAG: hypothetical protein EHM70_07075 [Chloroflexota bacterium]|nr:MAG: hypothetical protein EHM70_07075 [Chloroflexota bacterium]